MIIYHTLGIRRYLREDVIYTYNVATPAISPAISINTKTLLKSLKRKKK